jgi:predicted nucleic acid-binding protein
MRAFYLDASALAKRYAPELGTPLLNHLFSNVLSDRLYVLNISVAEVVWTLVRKRNAGQLPATAFSQALVDLGNEIISPSHPHKLAPDNALVAAAILLIQVHSVNATDAIILRSALDLAAQHRAVGNDLVLLSSDQRLLRAAQAEGLVTYNPETQDQAALDALLGP